MNATNLTALNLTAEEITELARAMSERCFDVDLASNLQRGIIAKLEAAKTAQTANPLVRHERIRLA